MHDENYKKIFAFPRVIEDLLRAFVPGDWLQEVNFATLDKLSTEYISDELLKRHGDNVWRMRLRKNWLYLLLLVEFQSTDDPLMALRIHTYTGLLYQELARNGQLDAEGRLPAVLPLVLYNGDEPWESPLQMGELIAPVGPLLAPYQPAQRYFVLDERRLQADDLPSRNRMSAVIALEQSRSPRDVARVADMLACVAAGPAGAAGVRGLDAADRGAAGAERRRVAADTEVGGREYDVGGTSGRVVQGVAEGRP